MEIEDRIARLEKEIEAIRLRNLRVEGDKAWETCATRTALICLITYMCACGFFAFLNTERWWLNALVPAAGYFLSTQSLHMIKNRWLNSHQLRGK